MKLSTLLEVTDPSLSDEQIKWLTAYVDNFHLVSNTFKMRNGKIDVYASFFFMQSVEETYDPIPEFIKFGDISKMIFSDGCELTSFALFPTKAVRIAFYDGSIMPKSLKGMSKVLKECEVFELNPSFKSGILEFFNIRGIKEITFNDDRKHFKRISDSRMKRVDHPIQEAIKIVMEHLPRGDVFECQDRLIQAGFKDYC